ncbi:MAG: hypothetical protein V1800_16795 [Candidatus Latescibacterota bacterium]
MKTKPKPYDMNAPEAKALVDEIVHGTFVKEGTMVAFPTCFPGVTTPIVSDESHITALDVTAEGMVYGGTSGRLTHLFVGMFHGVTGMIFDLGTVEGADHCAAICCGRTKFVACVNGSDGGRLITQDLQNLPFDLIQEWGFERQPFQDLGQVVAGERIVHAVADRSKQIVIGATEGHLFVLDLKTEKVTVSGEIRAHARLALGSHGGIFGLDEGDCLWRYEVPTGRIVRKTVRLPEGEWGTGPLMWARDTQSGLLYTADGAGNLFSFGEKEGFSTRLGRTPVAPVGPMAVTLDGRVFGTCGAQLSRLFGYDPSRGEVADLGVPVSVIERRRYGYTFGDAVVGRDGEILFGEEDDLGHLWLYFPKIAPTPCAPE